ncbi:MAG: FtsX-like permease family protein [Nocardioidaceae bacterium]
MRRFLARAGAAQAAVLLLVAMLVACTAAGTALATVGLRVSADTMFADALDANQGAARTIAVRYVGMGSTGHEEPEVGAEVAATTRDLSTLLGEPRPAVVGPAVELTAVSDAVPPGTVSVAVASYPELDPLVRFTDGRAPRETRKDEQLTPEVAAIRASDIGSVVEIALTAEASKELQLPVGMYALPSSKSAAGLDEQPVLQVVGIYQPVSDARSALDDLPQTRKPSIGYSIDEKKLLATALTASAESVIGAWPRRSTTQWTLPVTATPDAAQADDIARAVDRLTLAQWPRTDNLVSAQASTRLGQVAREVASQQDASNALAALPLVGLLVSGLTAVALAARLLARRRAADTLLLSARGASGGQLVALRGVEALLLVLPGAAAAGALALWLARRTAIETPSRTDVVVLAGICLLAVLTIVTASLLGSQRLTPGQQDARRQALADAAEGVVVLLGVAGVGLLSTRRNLQAGDPLLALVPVLAAAAATLLALRLLRGVLGWSRAAASRTRGVVSLVGPSRAVDVSRASALPALAIVLATSVAMVGVAVTDTIDRGSERVGWQAAGADVQVRGSGFHPDTVEAIGRLDGVDRIAPLVVLERADVRGRTGTVPSTAVIAADPAQLATLTAGSPAPLTVPAPQGDQLQVVASAGIQPRDGTVQLHYAQSVLTAQVVDRRETLPGLDWAGDNFLLVDLETLRTQADRDLRYPTTVLIEGSPDLGELRELVAGDEPTAVVVDRRVAAAEQRDAPITNRTVDIYLIATAVAGALALLGIAFAVAFGAAGRRRAERTLRTLGASRRQASTIAAVELVPTVLTAAVIGSLCGLLVAWICGAAIDLTVLLGELSDLTVRPAGASVLVVGGVTVVSALLATLVAVAVAGARRAAPVSETELLEES